MAGCTKTMKRLWISSREDAAIKKGFLIAGGIAAMLVLILCTVSSCSMLIQGGATGVNVSTYPSEDADMLAAEAQYCAMEAELQQYLDTYESTNDYDEYHFELDDIEHDPVSYTHLTQELFQDGKEALYCGLNALSNNLIMVDRKRLKNPNGLILGTPGSGKSFAAKREIANVFLVTDDDIIICAIIFRRIAPGPTKCF